MANELELLWPDRQWVVDHLDEIAQLFQEFSEVPWTEEQVLMELPGKWEQSLVACRSGAIVAFSFNSLKEDRLYVHTFFVSPSARRLGIGSRLMTTLRMRAADLDLPAVRLRVDASNGRAVQFYLRNGFVISKLLADRHSIEMEISALPANAVDG